MLPLEGRNGMGEYFQNMWYICITCHRGYQQESQLVEHKGTQHEISKQNKTAIIFGQMDLLPTIPLKRCSIAGTRKMKILTGPHKSKFMRQDTTKKLKPFIKSTKRDISDKNYLWENNLGSSIKICQVSTLQDDTSHSDIKIKNEPSSLDSCIPDVDMTYFELNKTDLKNKITQIYFELKQTKVTVLNTTSELCSSSGMDVDQVQTYNEVCSSEQLMSATVIPNYTVNNEHQIKPKYSLRPLKKIQPVKSNLSGSESENNDSGSDSDFSESDTLLQKKSKSQNNSTKSLKYKIQNHVQRSNGKSKVLTVSQLLSNRRQILANNDHVSDNNTKTQDTNTSTADTMDKPVPFYNCWACKHQSSTCEELKEHEKSCEIIITNHTCQNCKRIFECKIRLKHHQGRQHGVLVWNCSTCPKLFKTNSELKSHQLIHNINKPYKCKYDLCGKTFARPEYLKSHYSFTHTQDKIYECNICDRMYKTKVAVDKHKRYHHGEKRYVCDICNNKFCTNSGLKLHKYIHNPEKQFVCSDCGKKCTTPATLRNHVTQFHTRLQSYICDKCDMKFNSTSQLNMHKFTHTTEKLHLCSFCGKSFKRKRSLIIHLTRIHEDGPIECECCSRRFKKEEIFKKHIQRKQSNKHQRGECWKFYENKNKIETDKESVGMGNIQEGKEIQTVKRRRISKKKSKQETEEQ